MLAYIDAGTAAAIAAMATGGLAGAKVAAQSFFSGRRGQKARADHRAKVAEAAEDFETEEDFETDSIEAIPAS